MMTSRQGLWPSVWGAVPAAILILFAPLSGFVVWSAPPLTRTNQIAHVSANSLPARIVTTDGQIYNSVKLLRVLPDGLLVQYLPASGGMGLARLKFTKLPPSYQKQFGYNPEKASNYEQGEKIAMAELSRRMREDENIRIGVLAGMARSTVTVEAGSPVVGYKYYDPAGPTPPQIASGMQGVTQYAFTCDPGFNFRVTHQNADAPFDFHIESMTMHLGLAITIILPQGENGKLREHEEGHRKIVEYFYSLGPTAARCAAGLLTGMDQISSAPDYETARNEIFSRATAEVQAEYMKYIQQPCGQANEYYDELTDHGANNTDSNQAAQEAIRRYAPHLPN